MALERPGVNIRVEDTRDAAVYLLRTRRRFGVLEESARDTNALFLAPMLYVEAANSVLHPSSCLISHRESAVWVLWV